MVSRLYAYQLFGTQRMQPFFKAIDNRCNAGRPLTELALEFFYQRCFKVIHHERPVPVLRKLRRRPSRPRLISGMYDLAITLQTNKAVSFGVLRIIWSMDKAAAPT